MNFVRACALLLGGAAVLAASGCDSPSVPGRLPAVLPPVQLPATITVPGDFSTLAAALSSAAPGDVVALGPGVWSEDVTVPGGVIVQGEGQDATLIEGHVTVTGEGALRFLAVEAPSGVFGTCGIEVGASAGVDLQAVRVVGFEEGVCLDPGASPGVPWSSLDRVEFLSNTFGLVVASGQAGVTNSTFLYQVRSGIQTDPGASVLAVNNTLFGNAFGFLLGFDDAAISLGSGGASVVRNNDVTNNLSGLACDGCTATWYANNVWGNLWNYAGVSPSPADLSVDPLYVDVSSGDLHLTAASPLIDMGSPTDAPSTDGDGLTRPVGAGWDIGADEWSPSSVSLVINEVLANPTSEGTGEYLELANVGTTPVDLAGLVLSDGDSTDVLVPYGGGSTVVPPGGYGVVLDPDYAGDHSLAPNAVYVTVDTATLGNGLSTNDPIELREANGVVVIDAWTSPFDPGNGVSAERVDVTAGDTPSNWVASPCGASPGALNCAAGTLAPNDPSVLRITEVLANAVDEQTGEFVELWNPGPAPVELAGLVLWDGDSTDALVPFGGGSTVLPPATRALVVDPNYGGQYLVPAGVVLVTTPDATLGNGLANGSDPVTLLDLDGTTVIDSWSFPVDPGDGVSIERIDVTAGDVASNWTASPCAVGHSAGRLACAAGGIGAGLVLTEVMANPLDEQTGEFIELLNDGDVTVDLAALQITDGDAVDGLVILSGGTTLAPGQRALVVDSGWPDVASLPPGVQVLTTNDSSLGNGLAVNDPITLLESDGVSPVDTFWAPFNPGNGTSAEKVEPGAGDAGNWVASPCGSSPGLPNCVSSGGGTTLLITEVMANPLSEGTGEFVELKNVSGAPLDLAGLFLDDGDATDPLQSDGGPTVVADGAYALVLDADYAGEYPIPAGVVTVTVDDGALGSGLATSDPVSIVDSDGVTVLATFSFPTNPGNGVSIERIDEAVGDVASNWAPSPCGSSPGLASCAGGATSGCADGSDNDGDGWVDLDDPDCATGSSEVGYGSAVCNDGVDNDGDGATDAADAQCADGSGSSESTGCTNGQDDDGDGWTDSADPDCASAPYVEAGFGSSECNDGVDNNGDGDVDSDDSMCWNANAPEPLPYSWLALSEVMVAPIAVADSAGEWFELYNTLSVPVDLDGWIVYDGGGDSFTIQGTLIIPAQGVVVLGNNADTATNGGVPVDYEYSGFDLDDVDDEIYVDDPTATESFAFEYWTANGWPVVSGASMGLSGASPPSLSTYWYAVNWCAATTPWPGSDGDAGSPGQPNEVCP